MRYKRRTLVNLTGKLLLFVTSLLLWQVSPAQTKNGIPVKRILDGASGQLIANAALTVQDSLFYNETLAGKLELPYKVKNVITFSINEYATTLLPDTFSASVNLRIYYTRPDNSEGSVDKELLINYDTARPYTMRSSFVFENSHMVRVQLLGIRAAQQMIPVLQLENLMELFPVYKLSCTEDAVKSFNPVTVDPGLTNELSVSWPPTTGADAYDLEWAYIDQEALDEHSYGNPLDIALIFENNATRVTVADNRYDIPLLYDNDGVLYYRVRAVQEKDGYRRMETVWSTEFGGPGSYAFNGHERKLNWQSTITYAEDGKRKVVVNYFDGSLRSRQTVTKDNTTNTTVAGETLYDYQGRPAIQVLPAPTLNSVIKYAHNLNAGMNGAEYDKNRYDSIGGPEQYLAAHAEQMDISSGANKYYSPDNPEKNNGFNGAIPDAEGYAFSETEYMSDNTNRVRRQGGVGPDFQLGSNHEIKYFYNTASKEDLYALFGTEVGENTHYFKNMVSDANGQYSVSYVDMHGRTIATALAGTPANSNLEDLPSKEVIRVTDSLSGPGENTLIGQSLSSRHSYTVTQSGYYILNYELDPPVLKKAGCKDSLISYPGLYELKVRITDDAYNQRLPGKKPYEITLHNYEADAMSSGGGKLHFRDSVYLTEGSYDFVKTLTVSQQALEYYRDSIYLPDNVCITVEQEIEKQLAEMRKVQCVPDCQSCMASVGDWDSFRDAYVKSLGQVDTSRYRNQAWEAFREALSACEELCGEKSESDDIRIAMLLDMSTPSGQYAMVSDSASRYSIFYRNPKDETNLSPFADTSIVYKDELGNVDFVYDERAETWVKPNYLTAEQFAAQFKSSWAEALLPLHPEYCRLKAARNYTESDLWDRKFESVDSYTAARDSGYLNPLGLPPVYVKFPVNSIDPFFLNGSTAVRDSMGLKLLNYNNAKKEADRLTMWSMAADLVLCSTNEADCLAKYKTPAKAFSESMCSGDLDMAWRSFRSLYLARKREVMDWVIMEKSGCSSKITKLLTNEGKTVRFTKKSEAVANAGIDYMSNGEGADEAALLNSANEQTAAFYEANCRSYVSYWKEQMQHCGFDSTTLNEITEKLVAVCKEGADVTHPSGASTVRPGSTHQDKSFEAVLNAYMLAQPGNDPLVCNAQVIQIPKPYDKQPVYSETPGYAKPDNCQCEKLAALEREHQKKGKGIGTLSDYIKRTRGVTISQSDLNVLLDACQGSGSTTSGCSWMSTAIVIPALIQCDVVQACATCDEVKTVYNSFLSTYPGIEPALIVADSVQEQRNTLFTNYMNNHLGYTKQAWEYLSFINDSCKNVAGEDVTVCKERVKDGKQLMNTYSNGGTDVILDLVRSKDGGYLLAGSTTGCGAGGVDGYVIKTDSTGVLLWSKTYGGDQHDELIRVKNTMDSGYICIGNTFSYCYDRGAILIVKLDKNGNVEWNKAIDFGPDHGALCGDVIETGEGKFAFGGFRLTGSNSTDWVTGLLSDSGYVQWIKQTGGSRPHQAMSLLEDNDTLIALTGVNGSSNYVTVMLRENKRTGVSLATWAFGGLNAWTCERIEKTSEGYKLSVGSLLPATAQINASGGFLNINQLGKVTGSRFIGSPYYGTLTSWATAAIGNGGSIVAQSFGTPGEVTWHRLSVKDSILWSSRMLLDGDQLLRRIHASRDGSFAGAGTQNGSTAMLLLGSVSGKVGCNDTTDRNVTTWKDPNVEYPVIETQQELFLGDNNVSSVPLLALACTPVRTLVSSCPDSCYVIAAGPLLCGAAAPVFPVAELNNVTACSDSTYFAESAANLIYRVYVDSLKNTFEADYIKTALEAESRERFAVTYHTSEYHYTLYYYDQAGNLVKTIPPAGVIKHRRQTWIDSVELAKRNGQVLVPAHTMATNYRYNTLNGVVAQKTPDGGMSRFWYDRIGRIAVSQNKKQFMHSHYSYTFYDYLGRITEVGELGSANSMTDLISVSETGLADWLASASGSRHEIVKTIYDVQSPILAPDILSARNLRNRVAWTGSYDSPESLVSGYHNAATYYSYDVHGNVDVLLHDYRMKTTGGTEIFQKRVDYSYDLISGAVKEVAYQQGQPDAFYHRYSYDAENRITNVQTSQDRIYWENDAYYQYYKHGPLARTVLGQQQVQGIDYAYSLQGWLKGVNSTSLFADADQGNDGVTGSVTARDVYGFALHYFGAGDYKPINSTKNSFATAPGLKPLYNGNISGISQHISSLGTPLLYTYSYDVLNRLKGMQANKGLDLTSNTWTPVAINDFKESMTYDANGNILNYNRNGDNTFSGKPIAMDQLRYTYLPGTNRLDYISDDVSSSNYDIDIDEQLAGNYTYDSIGNLISDRAGLISNIEWTLYGKIASITKNDGTVIRYVYDQSGNRIGKDVGGVQTWYVRDAAGNVMSVYTKNDNAVNGGALTQSEAHLYGGSRLGINQLNINVENPATGDPVTLSGLGSGFNSNFIRGRKFFELSNHLGNVLATVSDRKTGVSLNGTTIDHYDADILSAQEYYPFGMQMPGRGFSSDSYRYGFNGKENDNEVKGEGNQQDYGMRVYDGRLGRFLSVDPLMRDYPWYTPYQFAGNKPIQFIDIDGKEEGWPDIFSKAQKAINTAVRIYEYADGAITTINDILKVVDNTKLERYAHLEGKYKVGARVALEIKKGIGIDIDLGSVEVLSVSADYNFETNNWAAEFNYLGKDGNVIGSQNLSLSVPAGMLLGAPAGVGGSVSAGYNFDTKAKKVNYTTGFDAGVGIGPVNLTNSMEQSKDKSKGEEGVSINGSVGSSTAAGVIVTGDYKIDMGIRVVSKQNR